MNKVRVFDKETKNGSFLIQGYVCDYEGQYAVLNEYDHKSRLTSMIHEYHLDVEYVSGYNNYAAYMEMELTIAQKERECRWYKVRLGVFVGAWLHVNNLTKDEELIF